MRRLKNLVAAAGLAVAVATIGCAGRPQIIPSDDPTLRKTSTEFAADAAKRFPYKSDAPAGDTIRSRAEIGYMFNRIELTNLSGEAWNDVDVWINQSYVLHLTNLKPNEDRSLAFQMFYDDSGHYYPTSGENRIVKKVELFKDGKMYSVTTQTAD
jgi:hypothetical protein